MINFYIVFCSLLTKKKAWFFFIDVVLGNTFVLIVVALEQDVKESDLQAKS